jgi:hypothetical protein
MKQWGSFVFICFLALDNPSSEQLRLVSCHVILLAFLKLEARYDIERRKSYRRTDNTHVMN